MFVGIDTCRIPNNKPKLSSVSIVLRPRYISEVWRKEPSDVLIDQYIAQRHLSDITMKRSKYKEKSSMNDMNNSIRSL